MHIVTRGAAHLIALCCALSGPTLFATPAHAQAVLEEVIVTARKREETLQEAPLAVTALSGDMLTEEGLRNLVDLEKIVPNVDVANDVNAQVYIRGVGARNPRINYDSGVGIYVDGAYASRMQGAILDNVDLANIQVLRGPQGTLFGKNTTGGAVLYTTNRPIDELEGNIELRLGNLGRQDFKGTINLPIIDDTLMSRFSAWSVQRDGYVDNAWNGDELNEENRWGGQGQLRWQPTDNFTADLNIVYAETDQAGLGADCEVAVGVPGAGFQAELLEPVLVHTTGQSLAEACADNGNLGEHTVLNDYVISENTSETLQTIVTLDWDVNDSINLKSISAWRDIDAKTYTEVDATTIPFLRLDFEGNDFASPTEADIFTQEIQLAITTLDDKLDLMFGAFYFKEEASNTVLGGQGPLAADSLPGSPSPLPGMTDFLFYSMTATISETNNESSAAYAQADFHFNDQWTLTAGLRYTDETRELYRNLHYPDTDLGSPPGSPLGGSLGEPNNAWLLPGGFESFNRNHGWISSIDPTNDQTVGTEYDDWTPMLSLRYTFEGEGWINSGGAYLTYSEGFLSGGVSEHPDALTMELETFEPEEVTNYEAGIKLIAADNTLTLNAALFFMDYEDRQLTSIKFNPETGLPAGSVINAEKVEISGLELETMWLPLPNLQLIANFSSNDGDIVEFNDTRIVATGSTPEDDCLTLDSAPLDVCSIDRSDEELPRLARWATYISARMFFPVADGMLVPQIAWSYRDSVEFCQDRGSCLSGFYNTDREDLSASITWSNESWRVRAWGNNLTDESYISGGQTLTDVTGTLPGTYNAPRTYGLDLGYRF